MSIPTTGSDGESDGPFGLRRRRQDGDRRTERRRQRGRTPSAYGGLPRPEPIEPEAIRASERSLLLTGARRRGAEAAERGVFDPWVLGGSDPVHYFAELASLRDRVREQLIEEDARAEEDARLTAARVRADSATADWRIQLTAEQRGELQERLRRTAAELDRLAQRADRWQSFRDSVREGFERQWLRRRLTGLGDDAARQAVDSLSDQDLAAEQTAQAGTGARTSAAWEGELPRSAMSRWGRVILLALLAVVELPVYYVVFDSLHGIGSLARLLSVSLTCATSVVMIVAPHIAGRVLRRRSATGSLRLTAIPALALTAAWGYGAWALGELRAKVVFKTPPAVQVPQDVADTVPYSQRHPQSILASLHLNQHSVTLMFVALLLLSGGIAFLLGLAEEHPYLVAYRHTRERLARLSRTEESDVDRAVHAREVVDELQARLADRRAAHDARLRAVDDLYEAAARAYLDGVAGAAKDPAMTEAVMRLGRQWPLLPEQGAYPARSAFAQER